MKTFYAALLIWLFNVNVLIAAAPPSSDYCQRLQQEIQGKKHGFLAGNVTYYVGGFHASWETKEHETIGLTHPFHHDLRSRGVGLVQSQGQGPEYTGTGNDFSGWEFYKDTRVLYGSVVMDGKVHHHPAPTKMFWRPDRMICEYEVDGVQIREQKFIAANDTACSIITASQAVTLRFDGQSFFGRHSLTSSATVEYNANHNAIHIVEGGTTKCKPETDRSEQVGPIMYQGMSTILAASRNFSESHKIDKGERGEMRYEFEIPCDSDGVVLVWAMHDNKQRAIDNAMAILGQSREAMLAKKRALNHQLNKEIPYFRCSDPKFEDIYYYLWSLYLMYYIDVGSGMETEPHTQTAVNNFLGMHRYDAAFQIKVGAWTSDQPHYAFGNVLTWKQLFENGHYQKSSNGAIALADTKGKNWHSGVYGNELSEHVLGAWQIYQHTGDVEFLAACYDGYFRKVFRDRIPPFFSNHFEVAEALIAMAKVTGHMDDVDHWKSLVSLDSEQIRAWFDQRWEANNHQHYFGGPKNGMLMTTGFWHLRSKYFPRDYASKMTQSWAFDKENGFYGEDGFFPLAMSRQAMKLFSTKVDQSFGYTPDTAYYLLDGLFRQRLGDAAWRLAVNHLENYNFQSDWNLPVAPEAYTRSGNLFGDQYSNFNAGKILLYLEGLAGLEYSIPNNRLVVHDIMPEIWNWMEVRLPIQKLGEEKIHWPVIRYERTEIKNEDGGLREVTKSIKITDSPLQIIIEPWTEEKKVIRSHIQPLDAVQSTASDYPNTNRYEFDSGQTTAQVELSLQASQDNH